MALALTAALSGCYSYRGGRLPTVDPASITTAPHGQTVVYRLRVESNVGNDDKLEDLALKGLVNALQSAGATVAPSGAIADPQTQLEVDVEAQGNVFAQMLSGFVSGFTWGLLPGYAYLDFTTEARVSGGDSATRTYKYTDSSTTWIQIFLLPLTNSQEQLVKGLVDDMMYNLVRDLQRDGLLPPPQVAGGAAVHAQQDD